MDKKKSLINISVALTFKIILTILTLIVKRFLIKYVGNEANGILSLYTSLIGFLAIADLGIGSAVIFSLYKPIVENDEEETSALYNLIVKLYRIIGVIIFCLGIVLMPFLKYFINDYSGSFNLYLTFFLMLSSVVITYFFSGKSTLIDANKDTYITNIIHSTGLLIQDILQIIVLVLCKSFEIYLLCLIVGSVIQWIFTSIYFKKRYKNRIKKEARVNEELKAEVIKNTKAMFLHRVGSLLVNTCDSIIISSFIGITILGKYSNYTTLILSMTTILTMFFTPLTSVIGHMCIEERENREKYFNLFYSMNYILGVVFFLGYYAVVNDFITLVFGDNLLLSKEIVIVITLNYFIQFMRQSCSTFKDATGTFYNDRYKPIIEGVLNLILSLVFVNTFGITGVIVATIITNLLICHTIEPYALYKNAFDKKPTKYYIVNYSLIIVFFLFLITFDFFRVNINDAVLDLIANGFIAVGLACIPSIFVLILNRKTIKTTVKKILHKYD